MGTEQGRKEIKKNPELVPICVGCGKTPEELSEDYIEYLEDDESATDYVLHKEGSLNRINMHFWCDKCYIKAGMPLGVAP